MKKIYILPVAACFFLAFPSNGFSNDQPAATPKSVKGQTVSISPEQLKGKTLHLNYSDAVYSSEYPFWSKKKFTETRLETEIKLDKDLSCSVQNYSDPSKKLKLFYKQLSPKTIVLDQKNDAKARNQDTYQFLFLSPQSGIATRLSLPVEGGHPKFFVSNIKFTLSDSSETNKKSKPVKSEDFTPKTLDGKKLLFDTEGAIAWDSNTIGEPWSSSGKGSKSSIPFNKNQGLYVNSRTGQKEEISYIRTGSNTAFLTTHLASLPETEEQLAKFYKEWPGGEDEEEFQLTFTAPNEGYAIWLQSTRLEFFQIFIKFRLVENKKETEETSKN